MTRVGFVQDLRFRLIIQTNLWLCYFVRKGHNIFYLYQIKYLKSIRFLNSVVQDLHFMKTRYFRKCQLKKVSWKYLLFIKWRLRKYGTFLKTNEFYQKYSVIHNSISPSKELCSKMAPGEVGVSFPWWCHALVLWPPGYWGLFLNLIIFL